MPFQKGNTLGAKGRPKGSKNKATDVNKFELQQTLYNMEEFANDFKALSPDKKMDIRMKAMGFFYSRPIVEIEVENTDYLNVEYITAIGEEVTDEQKKQMYLKHGHKGEMPLWLDEEFE
mgnify:CR=1 FL=1